MSRRTCLAMISSYTVLRVDGSTSWSPGGRSPGLHRSLSGDRRAARLAVTISRRPGEERGRHVHPAQGAVAAQYGGRLGDIGCHEVRDEGVQVHHLDHCGAKLAPPEKPGSTYHDRHLDQSEAGRPTRRYPSPLNLFQRDCSRLAAITAAAITAELRESISTGRDGPGGQLPSGSVLPTRHSVARGTVITHSASLADAERPRATLGSPVLEIHRTVVSPDSTTTLQDPDVLTADHAIVYKLPANEKKPHARYWGAHVRSHADTMERPSHPSHGCSSQGMVVALTHRRCADASVLRLRMVDRCVRLVTAYSPIGKTT